MNPSTDDILKAVEATPARTVFVLPNNKNIIMSAEQAVVSDAKTYSEGGKKFMLGQIEETNMALFHQNANELAAAIDAVIAKNGLDFFALMCTDPVRGNSELIFRGSEAVRKALPYRKSEHGTLLMPGVMSRKKQLLPEVISALS